MHNIFVKNLAFTATREDLKKLFETFGVVSNAMIKTKRQGKSMGFGFLEMPNEDQKNKAIAALNGKDFMGRPMTATQYIPRAKEASRPRERRPERNDARPSKPFGKTDFKAKATGYPRHDARPQRRDDGELKPFKKFNGRLKPAVKSGGSIKNFFNTGKPTKSYEKSRTARPSTSSTRKSPRKG